MIADWIREHAAWLILPGVALMLVVATAIDAYQRKRWPDEAENEADPWADR